MGLSLDWLFVGDVRGLVMAEHRRATEPREADKEAAEEIMNAIDKARDRWAALDVIATAVVELPVVRDVGESRALAGVVSDLYDSIEDAWRRFNTFCDRKEIQP